MPKFDITVPFIGNSFGSAAPRGSFCRMAD